MADEQSGMADEQSGIKKRYKWQMKKMAISY